MKKNGAAPALITPDAEGWRVFLPAGSTRTSKTLAEAAATLPAGAAIHLALPCTAALFDRLTLPSTDREELAGMVQLQLEKTLPYPIEEVTSDFGVVQQTATDSTVVTTVAHTPQIEQLCAPVRSSGQLPQRVTLFAAHVAASCPSDQTVLCVWKEAENLVVAICENAQVSIAQTLPGTDAAVIAEELPAMLLRAEIEGVPVEFASIRLEQHCSELRPALAELFSKPVELVSFAAGLPQPSSDLLPKAWETEKHRLESSSRLRQRLQLAAFLYLLLVAGAFVYLAWLKTRVRKIETEILTTQPQIALVQAQQARWRALEPAINPNRFTIEIWMLIQSARPSPDVKFNVLDHSPSQFMIEGEAPSANIAIEFGEKLRSESGLADFKLETPPPQILKDDRWKFKVFGKL